MLNEIGSIPKLRELQITGNPFDYPDRDIVNKGSKYLIRFLREKWIGDESNIDETIPSNTEPNTVKKLNSKIVKKNGLTNKKKMDIPKVLLMERYSWPMIFLTNWNSDRLVTDRDIRIKELERLYLEKQKVILEKQERILQSYKNKETLKVWRDKSKQMQLLESSHKLNNYPGLDIPFGVDKEFSKMMSRQAYTKTSKENIKCKSNTVKITSVNSFDFDLEMSDIYKMLTSLTTNIENTNNERTNVSKMSVVDWEVQKLNDIHKRISQLKSRMN